MAAQAVVDAERRPAEGGRDRISLTGITAFGHHGVLDFERRARPAIRGRRELHPGPLVGSEGG